MNIIEYVIKNKNEEYLCYSELSDFYWDEDILEAAFYSIEDIHENFKLIVEHEKALMKGQEPKIIKVNFNITEEELK